MKCIPNSETAKVGPQVFLVHPSQLTTSEMAQLAQLAQRPFLDLFTLIHVTVVLSRFIQVQGELPQCTASLHGMSHVLHDGPLPSTVLQEWCIHRLKPQLLQVGREAGLALDTLQATPINGQIQVPKASRQLTQHGTNTFLGAWDLRRLGKTVKEGSEWNRLLDGWETPSSSLAPHLIRNI